MCTSYAFRIEPDELYRVAVDFRVDIPGILQEVGPT